MITGDVAQECRQTQALLAPPPPLLIKDVYSMLCKIRCELSNLIFLGSWWKHWCLDCIFVVLAKAA